MNNVRLPAYLVMPLSLYPLFAMGKTIRVEYLQNIIKPTNIDVLSGLACRNYGRVVHIQISVDWPPASMNVETSGYKRLVFWNDNAEFLFPNGTYSYQHGFYEIDGYFIARSGGIHQGVISNAFEKVDDIQVLLNPSVEEVRVNTSGCR